MWSERKPVRLTGGQGYDPEVRIRKQDVLNLARIHKFTTLNEHPAHMLHVFTTFSWLWLRYGIPTSCILTIKGPPTLGNFPLPSLVPPWTDMLNPSLILNPEVSSQSTALSEPSTLTGLLTHHLPLSLGLGNQPGAAWNSLEQPISRIKRKPLSYSCCSKTDVSQERASHSFQRV